MQRRDFCKLVAAAAASAALPLHAQTPEESLSELPAGFDKLTEDYAQFCAKSPQERVFYALVNGRIVEQRLDDATWHPTGWGKPPALPIPGGSWDGVPMRSPIAGLNGDGPYKPTWDSLLQYDAPEWYRDAKFGIWAHWSPQCVPEDGDWYARNMYIQGSAQNKYQLEHYGPPSKFGYKDLCAQWTLLNWDPEGLINRYEKAGARFFIALANHHDGFDTWASKHQPWNAGAIGPHRDVVGTWAAAARKRGMRLGVTVHQARNWWWFQPSHGADKTGPLAGVPYDGDLYTAEGKDQWWQGLNPQRLYNVKHPYDALPDISYVKNFYDRTRDLIDQHNPDLLYFDNPRVPLGWGGMNLAAYFYNHNLATHGGKMEAVLTGKMMPPRLRKALVADIERGIASSILPHAWQSETCIGQWHYLRSLYEQPGEYGGYMHPRDVIHWLVDVVSKNGTFILNIPGKPDGTIDSKEIAVLDKITDWMQVNGDALYATRPWKTFGEGPNMIKAGSFQGNSISKLNAQDVRFTRNKTNTVIYAIFMGWPTGETVIQSLGTSAATNPGKIENVQLLGTDERVRWHQRADGLHVELPTHYQPKVDFAASLRIALA
ncbi:MAG: alpha-L-fucosidase [Acidobacteria bacterium]|jgi:alpha-L-fucosidase|nr:alpha-L-fucosidase [Acidobacteriota bacterium]